MGAVEYCQYLKQDQSGLNCSGNPATCTAVNYWHLPNEAELMVAQSNSWITGGSGLPGGFQDWSHYWSSTEYSSSFAWIAYGSGGDGNLSYYYDGKGNHYLVRCAH